MKYWGLNNNTLANISQNLAPEKSGVGGYRPIFFGGGGGETEIVKINGYLVALKSINSFDMHVKTLGLVSDYIHVASTYLTC